MYKGAYLFGNRVVIPKMQNDLPRKIARGSSSFVYDGVGVSRKSPTPPLAAMEENLYQLNEKFRQLQRKAKEQQICGCSVDEHIALAKAMQTLEFDRLALKKEIAYLVRFKNVGTSGTREKKTEGYTLNKQKVRDKCMAFFELEASKKFCAFYSVSFPAGAKEETIYKVWNSWLTNLRKTYGLKDYLWVAEYQKNGTLHYHMLCNVFMPIKRVNRAMAIGLYHNELLNDTTIDKYNGVDVKRVTGSRCGLQSYLTKYISKSETHVYKRAPWRCSQSVSALFTSIRIDDDLTNFWLQKELSALPLMRYENDFAYIDFFQVKSEKGWFHLPQHIRQKMADLNNEIIKQLNNQETQGDEEIHRNSIQRELSPLQVSERDETRQLGQVV